MVLAAWVSTSRKLKTRSFYKNTLKNYERLYYVTRDIETTR